jgi:uncharacterized membrane protein
MSNLGVALAVLGSLAWLYVVALTYRSGRRRDASASPAEPLAGQRAAQGIFRGQISPLSQ